MSKTTPKKGSGRPDHDYAPSIQALKARSTGAPQTSRKHRGWLKSDWMLPVLQGLANGLLALFWRTCRISVVQGQQHVDAALAQEAPVLICYWHQMHLFCARYLLGQTSRGLKLAFLISPSHAGDVMSGVIQRHGAIALRGSDTRTGGAALQQMYKAVREDGISPVLTLDGPSGPAHECKPGAIMLARVTGTPLLPISYAARRGWRLKTWDRFVVPRPFTRIAVAIGEPIEVPKKLGAEDVLGYQREVQERLNGLEAQAREAVEGT